MQLSTQASPRSVAPGWVPWVAGATLLAGAGIATFGYALLVEPFHIELERRTIRLPQAAGRLPAHGLRILHLSDSHFGGHDWRERKKIELVRRLVAGMEIDLLVHTGDFLHLDEGVDNVSALWQVLPRPRLGSFAVLGNHDYTHYNMGEALPRMWHTFMDQEVQREVAGGSLARARWRGTRWLRYIQYVRNMPLDGLVIGANDTMRLQSVLAGLGVQVLHNRSLHFSCAADQLDFYLAGVDDYSQGAPDLGSALAAVPADATVLLLSHNPDIIGDPLIDRVEVVLAGHTHGGQLVLPLWGPAHTQSAYLKRTNVAGYFQHGRTHFYVSRGMGEGFPLRFRAWPQIALITIVGG